MIERSTLARALVVALEHDCDVPCPNCGQLRLVLRVMDAVGYVTCRNCHFLTASCD